MLPPMALNAFQLLADPSRLAIVELLRLGERPVGDLVDHLQISQPAVSKQLRVLKEGGLVDVRPEAQRRLYRLRPDHQADLDALLLAHRRLWAKQMDRLEAHLDRRRKQ